MYMGDRVHQRASPRLLARQTQAFGKRWLSRPAVRLALPMVLGLGLAACGGAPDSSDIQVALQRHFADAVAPAQQHYGQHAGRALVPTVQAVALQGCSAREGGHYLCDAQVTLHSKVLGQRHATTRLLLARDGQGWRVLSQL